MCVHVTRINAACRRGEPLFMLSEAANDSMISSGSDIYELLMCDYVLCLRLLNILILFRALNPFVARPFAYFSTSLRPWSVLPPAQHGRPCV